MHVCLPMYNENSNLGLTFCFVLHCILNTTMHKYKTPQSTIVSFNGFWRRRMIILIALNMVKRGIQLPWREIHTHTI